MTAQQGRQNFGLGNGGMKERDATLGRPLFLGLLSIVLCSSFIMSIFTPFPLTLLILLYGRIKGALFGGVGLAVMFALGWKVFEGGYFLPWAYLGCLILAFFIAEIFFRNWSPVRGFMRLGVVLVSLAVLFFGATSLMTKGGLQKVIYDRATLISEEIKKNQIKVNGGRKGEETKEMIDFLSKPELITKDVIRSLPSSIVLGIFISLWINLFLVLRSYRSFRIGPFSAGRFHYSFTEADFLNFKVKEWFVWPLILVLAAMLMGEKLIGEVPFVLCRNSFFIMGMFYFFQGFGIFVDVLALLKVTGFFRSFLVVLTVVTSYPVLAALGLFDMWVDFRGFVRKRINRDGNKD
jgi:hypothetical protein